MTMIDRNRELVDQLATSHGVQPAALRALFRVEAGAEGLVDGHPIIRLEVHKFWHEVPAAIRPQVDLRFQVKGPRAWEGHQWLPSIPGKWTPLHTGQTNEWAALQFAKGYDERAAIVSTSWGAGQILGSHWAKLGYSSPSAFVDSMHKEAEQIRAVVKFLKVNGILSDLAERDWPAVARAYNGPGQVEWYAGKLKQFYEAESR